MYVYMYLQDFYYYYYLFFVCSFNTKFETKAEEQLQIEITNKYAVSIMYNNIK